jgi:tetratricopeptide (TPR) repeat protein
MNALLEHSLVRHFDDVNDEPRYTMLETIREYATEQLEASGEAERIRGAHTGHLLALAERARREIEGARQQAWYRRLDEALGDLRAAFAFAQAAALDEEVLRFGPALYPYWSSRGLLHDFRSWAAIAEPRLRRGSPLTRANALHAIGFIRATDADLTGAESMYREAATVRRKFGDVDGALSSLNNIGTIHLDRGDYTAAEDVLRECLALQPDSPHATANLGECALELGKDSEAQELFETALRIFRERGDAESEVFTISELARLALAQGDVPGADRLLAEARRLVERQADSGLPRMIDLLEAQLLMQTGRLSEARMKAIRSLEFVYQGKYPRGIAEALDVLGEAALRDMDPGVAGRLWGCLESLLAATGLSFSPRRLRQRSELIGSLGPAIAPGVLEDAMAQGRLLDLDSAVRLAEAADEPLDSAAAPDSSSPLS